MASLNEVKHKHNALRMSRLLSVQQIFIVDKRQAQIKLYQLLSDLDSVKFERLCQSLLSTLANYLQDLPETRNSYFSGKGGFLNHVLSRCEASMQSCRAYFMNEQGKAAKALSTEQKLWLYCLFSASLLRGIGRVLVDLNVEIFDGMGKHLGRWDPMLGSMQEQGALFYDYDFDKANHDTFRRRVTLVLATKLMPKDGLAWLSKQKDIFAVWLALLDEDLRAAGTLGIILDKAEAVAINRFFQEKNLEKYNQEAGTGIGRKFSAPEENLHQLDFGVIPQEGAEFIKWLLKNLGLGRFIMNQSPLLAVPGGFLMSADVFKLFVREHPQFKNWQKVQDAFSMMQLHNLSVEGNKIQTFKDVRTNTTHSGMVLSSVGVILPETFKMVADNGLIQQVKRHDSATIQHASSHMVAELTAAQPMQALSKGGQWLAPGSLTQIIISNKNKGG